MEQRTIEINEVEESIKFIDAQTLFDTVDQIRATGKVNEFFNLCTEGKRGVAISKQDASFIKQFLADYANETLMVGTQSREKRMLRTAIRRTARSGPRC